MKELNDRPIDPEIVQLVLSQKRTSNLKSINEMNGIAEKVTMQTLDLEKYVNKIKTDYNANEIIFYKTLEKPVVDPLEEEKK